VDRIFGQVKKNHGQPHPTFPSPFFFFCNRAGSVACSLRLLAAYFQPVSSVFLSRKSGNSIFSRLFSAQANKPVKSSALLPPT
jgi:hypothetical protein